MSQPLPDSPEQVGSYRVLQEFRSREASVRIIEMNYPDAVIAPHVHLRSNQSYLAISGSIIVTVSGIEHTIGPYEIVNLPIGEIHSARPVDGTAILANISVPPIAPDDQRPTPPDVTRNDLELPTIGTDFDD